VGAVKEVVKHQLQRTVGVLSTLLVIAGIVWAIYVAFVRPTTKPNPSTTQKADSIVNQTYNYPEKKGLIDIDLLWGWLRLSAGPPKQNK